MKKIKTKFFLWMLIIVILFIVVVASYLIWSQPEILAIKNAESQISWLVIASTVSVLVIMFVGIFYFTTRRSGKG